MSYIWRPKEGPIASLFAEIGQKETAVEARRQQLGDCPDFTVDSFFAHLDIHRSGRISEREFCSFAHTHRVTLTERDALEIIKQYDNDQKGWLTIAEFENFVLSAERPVHKDMVLGRRRGTASLQVKDRFIDLILAEADFNGSLSVFQSRLEPLSDDYSMFTHLTFGRLHLTLYQLEDLL